LESVCASDESAKGSAKIDKQTINRKEYFTFTRLRVAQMPHFTPAPNRNIVVTTRFQIWSELSAVLTKFFSETVTTLRT
jgi:hypothetical protein